MSDYIYINPGYAAMLRQAGLDTLPRLLAWSGGELVGEHGARRTWRTTLADAAGKAGTFYVRQEHRVPFAEVAEDLAHFQWPSSRGYKTFQATRLFSETGIAVAPLCAMVERRFLERPVRAAAIQAQAPGRDLYNELLAFGRPETRTDNPPARRRLLVELGALLARMHRAKIFWPDLAAKHIYVAPIGSERHGWQFTLIDVERAREGLDGPGRERQMQRFLDSLRGLLTPTDLLRMALGYLELDMAHPRDVRRRLEAKFLPKGLTWLKRAREEMEALRGLPDDQPLPEEELYERVNGAVVNMRFKPVLREMGLLEKGALWSFRDGRTLDKPGLGRRERIQFDTVSGGSRMWFYLKRIRHPKIQDQADRALCGTIRHSGCWHERYMIKQLGRHRIPAPVVVAYAERMSGGYERAGALITQGIVGQSLERFVPKQFARGADRPELARRREWIRQLAALIGRFHRAGFCHRDLYLSHIFIGFKRNGRAVFHLIDLARAFTVRLRKDRWRIKDLAALNYSAPRGIISNTDRMRFLRAYLGKSTLNKADKSLVRKIVRKTRQIERHNARRRAHPLSTPLSSP